MASMPLLQVNQNPHAIMFNTANRNEKNLYIICHRGRFNPAMMNLIKRMESGDLLILWSLQMAPPRSGSPGKDPLFTVCPSL